MPWQKVNGSNPFLFTKFFCELLRKAISTGHFENMGAKKWLALEIWIAPDAMPELVVGAPPG